MKNAAPTLLRLLRRLDATKAPAGFVAAVMKRVTPEDAYGVAESAIGTVYVAYGRSGISAVMKAASDRKFEDAYFARFGRSAHRVATLPRAIGAAISRPARSQLGDLRFDLSDRSAFQRAVLAKALEIPPGQTRPYGWIAREIGRPKAVRAVGSALATNPIPLLIPCHRVVRNDGKIGEYALGSANKRRLLAFEGALLT